MSKIGKIDKFFLGIVITLLGFGFFSFVSASLGVLARSGEDKFWGIIISQSLGLVLGALFMWLFSRIDYKFWRRNAFYLFLFAIGLTLLVFIPSLSFEHGGARRWITLGPISFQPVEILKIAFIIYFAGWLSWVKAKAKQVKFGILPLVAMLLVVAAILLQQPDTKSIILIFIASASMLILSGVPWRYIFIAIGIGALMFGVLAISKPYLFKRVTTFLNPSSDLQGSSFQLQQSLIGIGSGGIFGRGLGQSLQKFTYLPEPQGDSIFAVVGEEFGFIGTTIVVVLFLIFGLRGMRIAYRAPDSFGRLMVAGLVILLLAQSFLNIASIIGLFPLTGVPLVFISHGGTSLMIAMATVGIILNVSRYQLQNR
ncbi:MAG: putative lipid II flippase FtsW [Bacteroidetes bacterium]|nr:putative lipid II flippase FtsW [Bacteroidota bacterium]